MPIGLTSDGKPKGDDFVAARAPNKIVLCFDGTGNMFAGNPSDTNIVKLLRMCDHTKPDQKHYYQPGIGTYTADGSVNRGFFGNLKANFSQTIDTGLATSFDRHVMAGYRFLMRYYTPGDLIYVFGFSRGAFTARFTSRMVADLGLLSAGNEEMVPFAYKVFQDAYLEDDPGDPTPDKTDEEDLSADEEDSSAKEDSENNKYRGGPKFQYLTEFKKTFCTHDAPPAVGVKVHFLGLFDTVSSVGTFDAPGVGRKKLPSVNGTARHVRHAVAIDERRVKFKADLLLDKPPPKPVEGAQQTEPPESIKEVWFAGNHCDIGGGYPPEDEVIDVRGKTVLQTFWATITRIFQKSKPPAQANINKNKDWFQLSDITLKWMLDELAAIPETVYFDRKERKSFQKRYDKHRDYAVKGRMHDTTAFGRGSGFGMVCFWKFMEWLPVIRRWEYFEGLKLQAKEKTQKAKANPDDDEGAGSWDYVSWPPNRRGTRDIPAGALFHASVLERFEMFPNPTIKKAEGSTALAAAWQPNNDIYVRHGTTGDNKPKYEKYQLHEVADNFNADAVAKKQDHDHENDRYLNLRKRPTGKGKGKSASDDMKPLLDGHVPNFVLHEDSESTHSHDRIYRIDIGH